MTNIYMIFFLKEKKKSLHKHFIENIFWQKIKLGIVGWLIDWLFLKGMSTSLVLLHTKRLENCIHGSYTLFCSCFLRVFFAQLYNIKYS